MKNKVTIINMPFFTIHAPSLEIGLLKALLDDEGMVADIKYANLDFYNFLGDHNLYMNVVDSDPELHFSDWLVSDLLFDSIVSTPAEYNTLLKQYNSCSFYKNIQLLRNKFVKFSNEFISKIDMSCDIVIFNCKYMNLYTTLYIAKRIKEYNKKIVVCLFGELVQFKDKASSLIKIFNQVDAIFHDLNYKSMVHQISFYFSNRYFDNIAGFISQKSFRENKKTIKLDDYDINALPCPNYDDYFDSPTLESIETILAIETSRGCWWKKCKFCSAKGPGVKYVFKSPDKIADEVIRLSTRYEVLKFEIIDICLPPKIIDNFSQKILSAKCDFRFFWETRVELKSNDFRMLHQCGVRTIQVGIESLSTRLLKKIGKGNSKLINIWFLKKCKEAGIEPIWNLLYSFPEEIESDHKETLETLKYIQHLSPPQNMIKVRCEYGSDYYLKRRWADCINTYKFIVPDYIDRESTQQIATYFEFNNKKLFPNLVNELKELLLIWKNNYQNVSLTINCGPDFIIINDNRSLDHEQQYILKSWQKSVYIACKDIISLKELIKKFIHVDETDLRNFISTMIKKKLVIDEDQMLLSLATQCS